MKKSIISLIIIMLTLTTLNIQARGQQAQGGGQRGGQGGGQRQGGGSGDMRREQSQIHQQGSGQYQQGGNQQNREMNQNRYQQSGSAQSTYRYNYGQ